MLRLSFNREHSKNSYFVCLFQSTDNAGKQPEHRTDSVFAHQRFLAHPLLSFTFRLERGLPTMVLSHSLQELTLVTLEKQAVVITLTVLASFLGEES